MRLGAYKTFKVTPTTPNRTPPAPTTPPPPNIYKRLYEMMRKGSARARGQSGKKFRRTPLRISPVNWWSNGARPLYYGRRIGRTLSSIIYGRSDFLQRAYPSQVSGARITTKATTSQEGVIGIIRAFVRPRNLRVVRPLIWELRHEFIYYGRPSSAEKR
jgi:hypothetical protein